MEPQAIFNPENLGQLKQKIDNYEKALKQDMDYLSKQITETSQYWDKIRNYTKKLFSDKRTLYIIGGVVVAFFVLRLLLSRRTKSKIRRLEAGKQGGELIISQAQSRSWLGELLRTAIQTFILHYARKLLMQYIDRAFNQPKGERPA